MTNEIKTWQQRQFEHFSAEVFSMKDDSEFMEQEIAELRAKVESLAADAERLDFMTHMGFTRAGRYSGMVQVVWMDDILDRHLTNGKNIRDALDKCIAMAKEKA